MSDHTDELQAHPANAVFALMEDRNFRFGVIRPALEARKQELCRLATGKHMVKGFRNIAKAPVSMLLQVISDEANLSAELARGILEHWMSTQGVLRERVTIALRERGYEPKEQAFDEHGEIGWRPMSPEHAQLQYDGAFIDDEDANAVMLMSLLLGWFGGDEDDETESDDAENVENQS